MQQQQPDVRCNYDSHKLFFTAFGDKVLVTSPILEFYAVMNQSAAAEFSRCSADEALSLIAPDLDRNIAFSDEKAGEFSPSMLGIIPTRGCNIGCTYCNFGGPEAEFVHMSPETAVAAVDYVAEQLKKTGQDKMRVHFFGGEPFASKDIVDIVIHRTRLVCSELNITPYFDVSTNGIFSERYAEYVGEYFDSVVLSFDGYQHHHDKARPGKGGQSTFNRVMNTARRLSRAKCDLYLRVCITDESVDDMVDMTRWMINIIQPKGINYESITPGELAQSSGLMVPDPYKFARNYIKSWRLAEEIGVQVIYSTTEANGPRTTFCPVGTDSFIVTPDGRASACYLMSEEWESRGLDLEIARIDKNSVVHLDDIAVNRVRSIPANEGKLRCEDCFCQYSCSGGCHVNQTYPGCSQQYSDFCEQTRLLTASMIMDQLGYAADVDKILNDDRLMRRLNQQ